MTFRKRTILGDILVNMTRDTLLRSKTIPQNAYKDNVVYVNTEFYNQDGKSFFELTPAYIKYESDCLLKGCFEI